MTRRVRASIAGAAVLTLAACGSSSSSPAATTQSGATSTAAPVTTLAPSTTASAKTTYPVTITDCAGKKFTFAQAPVRVVTLDPAVTEIMLVLGLKDHIVGVTSFDDGPQAVDKMWPVTREDMKSLTVINDPKVGYPAKEKVVAAKPDLVASEYPSAFDPAYGPGTQDSWSALGINSYLTHGGCAETSVWTDLSVLYQDFRDFGAIFDVQDRAEAEIAMLQGKVAALQKQVKDAQLPDYSIGTHDGETEHPGTLGTTTANAIITLAGSHYAFLKEDTGAAISWETFVQKNPDVIWVITGLGNSADQIEQQLSTDPRTAGMPAVKNKRFVIVAYDDVGESPRIIDGLTALVTGLLALPKQ
jgi:iron complex transport system substrate-binding protein